MTPTGSGQVRVSVIGTGEIGRGWAALCIAQGWPVSLYDSDSTQLSEAPTEISDRARMLVFLDRADKDSVEAGIKALTLGRSLLHACANAQWVIEAVPECGICLGAGN